MKEFSCKHKGCRSVKHKAKGYCIKHYTQFIRHGKTFKVTKADFNEIVDKGTYYELILLDVKMNEVGRAKIDKEDLARVKSSGRWCLDSEKGYVVNKQTSMHRLIMNAKDNEEVDHKETGFKNKADNRKQNLRVCTDQQNKFNRGLNRSNTSGFKGVSRLHTGKWRATIRKNGKVKNLGHFNTPEEAYNIYLKAAQATHKEFIHSTLTPKTKT